MATQEPAAGQSTCRSLARPTEGIACCLHQPTATDCEKIKAACASEDPATWSQQTHHNITAFRVLTSMDLCSCHEDIIVDFQSKNILLPLNLREKLNIESESVPGCALRYVVLNPGNTEGLRFLDYIVMISATVKQEVINIYLSFEEAVDAVRAVNAIRCLMYKACGDSDCLLQTLQPYIFQQVFVQYEQQDTAVGLLMFLLLDEQCLLLYPVSGGRFAVRPELHFVFHPVPSSSKCESIKARTLLDGKLQISTNAQTVCLAPAADTDGSKMVMDKVYHLLTAAIKAKQRDIFSTQKGDETHPTKKYALEVAGWQQEVARLLNTNLDIEGLKRQEWATGYCLDIQHATEASRDPGYFWDNKLHLQAPVMDVTDTDPVTDINPVTDPVTDTDPPVKESATGSWDRPKSIDHIFLSQPDISVHSEDAQAMWVVAEVEMKALIEDGLVPSSSIKSVGLDANSFVHFERCVNEVQGALLNQRFDEAVSHIRGMQQVFRDSKVWSLRAVANMDELQVAACIFFAV